MSERYCHSKFNAEHCIFGEKTRPTKVLLLGDSHAGHYQPLLDQIGQGEGFSFVGRSEDRCFPLVKLPSSNKKIKISKKCAEQIAWAEQQIKKFDVYVLAGNWLGYQELKTYADYEAELNKTIDFLKKNNKKVVLLEQVPEAPHYMSFLRKYFSLFPFNDVDISNEVNNDCGKNSRPANAKIKALANSHEVIFLELISAFEKIKGPLPIVANEFLYKDNGHLNENGAIFIGKWLTGQPSSRLLRTMINQ